jgi:hypothetical protein
MCVDQHQIKEIKDNKIKLLNPLTFYQSILALALVLACRLS